MHAHTLRLTYQRWTRGHSSNWDSVAGFRVAAAAFGRLTRVVVGQRVTKECTGLLQEIATEKRFLEVGRIRFDQFVLCLPPLRLPFGFASAADSVWIHIGCRRWRRSIVAFVLDGKTFSCC